MALPIHRNSGKLCFFHIQRKWLHFVFLFWSYYTSFLQHKTNRLFFFFTIYVNGFRCRCRLEIDSSKPQTLVYFFSSSLWRGRSFFTSVFSVFTSLCASRIKIKITTNSIISPPFTPHKLIRYVVRIVRVLLALVKILNCLSGHVRPERRVSWKMRSRFLEPLTCLAKFGNVCFAGWNLTPDSYILLKRENSPVTVLVALALERRRELSMVASSAWRFSRAVLLRAAQVVAGERSWLAEEKKTRMRLYSVMTSALWCFSLFCSSFVAVVLINSLVIIKDMQWWFWPFCFWHQ